MTCRRPPGQTPAGCGPPRILLAPSGRLPPTTCLRSFCQGLLRRFLQAETGPKGGAVLGSAAARGWAAPSPVGVPTPTGVGKSQGSRGRCGDEPHAVADQALLG